MYPDYPQSDADLVPLPHCDGPKLAPFDFGGPQAIEFLEFLGEGLHAFVFKVAIHGQIYALKLFRFVADVHWTTPNFGEFGPDCVEKSTAFYNYSEPFNCECRAFGRLAEAGREDLALRCYGYVLLDEKHERAMQAQFPHVNICSDIDRDYMPEESRLLFVGPDGSPPPIRGIVKQFGQPYDEEEVEVEGGDESQRLRPAHLRKMLRDVRALQQIGIVAVDVASRQLVDGHISDFSTAITVPHFITTPDLNPHLTPAMVKALEYEFFDRTINDYLEFDEMATMWNQDHASGSPSARRRRLKVWAFPDGRGCWPKYRLREQDMKRVFTFVDPRQYDWKTRGWKTGGRKAKRRPPKMRRWVYNCDSVKAAERLRGPDTKLPGLSWEYRDGYIFPVMGPAQGPLIIG
ncbi:kinetochore Sim4 complex subunit FTA2-domain-containing protein [Nemania sp. FL0916]|nr:kinetochore Sim4 complex subunit FTA2-domain-containing protein [Nemania sp. FL0916]